MIQTVIQAYAARQMKVSFPPFLLAFQTRTAEPPMVTLRVVRHDRHEQVLAECLSSVVPARGEALQLDTVDARGEQSRPSTIWRVVSVTLHVPSQKSAAPSNGSA